MIVFINGPFGIGKTTTAKLVAQKVDRALIFDPEVIGELLQKMLGKLKPVSDFQEYGLWPVLTVQAARIMLAVLKRPLVIPMTITNKNRWQYISSGLRSADPDLICVRLTCSEQELRRRIVSRPNEEGSHEWCLSHVSTGLELMQDAQFGQPIDTELKTPEQVADAVVSAASIAKRSS